MNLIFSLIQQPSSRPRRLSGKSVFLHSLLPHCRDYILFHSHGQCQVVLGNTIILCMCCPHQIIYFWEPGRTDTNAYAGILQSWSMDRLSKAIIYKMELSDNNYSKLWKILKEMGIPDYLTCLLRNLDAGQEATVRTGHNWYAGQEVAVKTGHGTTNWLKIGKGICQGCILSPCLFNLYVEYIIWWAAVYGVAESRTWLKRLSSSSRIHHEKRRAGGSTSWNQDCPEK